MQPLRALQHQLLNTCIGRFTSIVQATRRLSRQPKRVARPSLPVRREQGWTVRGCPMWTDLHISDNGAGRVGISREDVSSNCHGRPPLSRRQTANDSSFSGVTVYSSPLEDFQTYSLCPFGGYKWDHPAGRVAEAGWSSEVTIFQDDRLPLSVLRKVRGVLAPEASERVRLPVHVLPFKIVVRAHLLCGFEFVDSSRTRVAVAAGLLARSPLRGTDVVVLAMSHKIGPQVPKRDTVSCGLADTRLFRGSTADSALDLSPRVLRLNSFLLSPT